MRVLGIGIILAIAIPLDFCLLVLWGAFGPLPGKTEIKQIQHQEATRIFSKDGKTIGKFYIQDRTPVAISGISPYVIKALVATEDKRFYSHNGIDFRSIPRVIVKTVLLGDRKSGGASTITQQLAKNLFPRRPYRYLYYPINKVREMITALRLESAYSKDGILELYLNTVSFGKDIYGIESASQRFFHTSASRLNIQQASLLVGMLKATTNFNPVRNPQKALNRRNMVLRQMVEGDYLTQNWYDSLMLLPVDVQYSGTPGSEAAGYFKAYLKNEVQAILKEHNEKLNNNLNIYTDGLKIYTTLDAGLQAHAELAVKNQMANLQKVFDDHWGNSLWTKNRELLGKELQRVSHGRSKDQLNERQPMYLFTWNGLEKREMSAIDSLKHYLRFLHVGFLALDPNDGSIRVWVGGIDHQFFPFDHVAVNTKRQVGSAFKPIVYAAALENGISPCKYYKAKQLTYEDDQDKEWRPGNANRNYDGKYTMTGALEESVNTVSVKILNDVGIDNTIKIARKMGIESDIPAVPSIALGTPSISLYEMVAAYGSFANNGHKVTPYFIERIEDKQGNVLYRHKSLPKLRVMDQETSMIMVQLLKNVVDQGTARSLRSTYKLQTDIGGKTGTSQSNADGWFIAVTPNLVAGTWVGGSYPSISFESTRLGQGAATALPIFGRFYQSLTKDPHYQSYTRARFAPLPANLRRELACDPFKDNFNVFDWLFGPKDKTDESRTARKKSGKTNIFKKFSSIFQKKKY